MSNEVVEIIKVVTNDGQDFTVIRNLIEKKSTTMKDLIDGVTDVTKDVIPLTNVNGKSFTYIVQWLTQHKDDPEPAPSTKTEEEQAAAEPHAISSSLPKDVKTIELSDWDKEFFDKLDRETQFELILATNYLDIRQMLQMLCQTIANSVLGKTPKQIYEMFNVKDELTPEEEEEVRKENPWLEDN